MKKKIFFQILEEQLSYFNINQKIKDICIFIINNLNAKGYLEISKVEIKNILSVNDKDLKEAFNIIYSFRSFWSRGILFRRMFKDSIRKEKDYR